MCTFSGKRRGRWNGGDTVERKAGGRPVLPGLSPHHGPGAGRSGGGPQGRLYHAGKAGYPAEAGTDALRGGGPAEAGGCAAAAGAAGFRPGGRRRAAGAVPGRGGDQRSGAVGHIRVKSSRKGRGGQAGGPGAGSGNTVEAAGCRGAPGQRPAVSGIDGAWPGAGGAPWGKRRSAFPPSSDRC